MSSLTTQNSEYFGCNKSFSGYRGRERKATQFTHPFNKNVTLPAIKGLTQAKLSFQVPPHQLPESYALLTMLDEIVPSKNNYGHIIDGFLLGTGVTTTLYRKYE